MKSINVSGKRKQESIEQEEGSPSKKKIKTETKISSKEELLDLIVQQASIVTTIINYIDAAKIVTQIIQDKDPEDQRYVERQSNSTKARLWG